MSTLISLQQTAQSSQAASFLGATVSVNGSTAQLVNGNATWNYSLPSAANVNVTITNASGQTVYSQSGSVQAGQQQFSWNGQGTNGQQWPAGAYTMAITAADAQGKSVAVSTQVQGIVSSVDLAQNPPVLTVNGQQFTVNQIQSVALPSGASG